MFRLADFKSFLQILIQRKTASNWVEIYDVSNFVYVAAVQDNALTELMKVFRCSAINLFSLSFSNVSW